MKATDGNRVVNSLIDPTRPGAKYTCALCSTNGITQHKFLSPHHEHADGSHDRDELVRARLKAMVVNV